MSGSRARAGRRRGFTLVELVVYAGLVSVGLAVLLGLEVSARRTAASEGDLLDVAAEADALLGAFRLDVEAARDLRLREGGLDLERIDGARVRYDARGREEAGDPARRATPSLAGLELTLLPSVGGAPPVARAVARFERRGAHGLIARRFERSAAPRLEVWRAR